LDLVRLRPERSGELVCGTDVWCRVSGRRRASGWTGAAEDLPAPARSGRDRP